MAEHKTGDEFVIIGEFHCQLYPTREETIAEALELVNSLVPDSVRSEG